MVEKFQIRLGGVEGLYDSRHGLRLYHVHSRDWELQLCDADVLRLLEFMCRHNQEFRESLDRAIQRDMHE